MYACNKNKRKPKSILPQMCIADLVAAISAAASLVIVTVVLSFICPLTYERKNILIIFVRGKM
jgi:predicted ABC-type sugar transport system permease subunit